MSLTILRPSLYKDTGTLSFFSVYILYTMDYKLILMILFVFNSGIYFYTYYL